MRSKILPTVAVLLMLGVGIGMPVSVYVQDRSSESVNSLAVPDFTVSGYLFRPAEYSSGHHPWMLAYFEFGAIVIAMCVSLLTRSSRNRDMVIAVVFGQFSFVFAMMGVMIRLAAPGRVFLTPGYYLILVLSLNLTILVFSELHRMYLRNRTDGSVKTT